MKMKSWFNNGIVLGNKYESFEFTMQNKNFYFNISQLFSKKYFSPTLGIGFIINLEKNEENFDIIFNIIFFEIFFGFYPFRK